MKGTFIGGARTCDVGNVKSGCVVEDKSALLLGNELGVGGTRGWRKRSMRVLSLEDEARLEEADMEAGVASIVGWLSAVEVGMWEPTSSLVLLLLLSVGSGRVLDTIRDRERELLVVRWFFAHSLLVKSA